MKIENILNEKIAIHCETEKQAKNLFEQFKEMDLKWCDDDVISANNTMWEIHKAETCYSYNNGEKNPSYSNGVTYSDMKYYNEDDYRIVEFEDLEEFKEKISINEIIDTRTAIHCETENEACKLLEELDKIGITWCTENPIAENGILNDTNWEVYETETCYECEDRNEGISYSDKPYFQQEDYKIVKFKEIEFEEFKPRLRITGAKEGQIFSLNHWQKKGSQLYKIENGILLTQSGEGWIKSMLGIDYILESEIEIIQPKIKISEKERKILEGRFAEGYRYIVKDGNTYEVYTHKPQKMLNGKQWYEETGEYERFNSISSKLKFGNAIKLENEEPTSIEEFLQNSEIE